MPLIEFIVEGKAVSHQTKNRKALQVWQAQVRAEAAKVWNQPPMKVLIQCTIMNFYGGPAPDLDDDNMVKPIRDALNGLVYEDDFQIRHSYHAQLSNAGRYLINGSSKLVVDAIREGKVFVFVRIEDAPLNHNYRSETMKVESEVPWDLAHIAEKYRAEGYEVTLNPKSDQSPAFAAAFHPEILARNNGLQVLVAVKENQAALKKDPDVSRMAEVVNAQPGWRFDLVVLHGTPEWEQVLEEAVEPSLDSLLHTLDCAERTAQAGDATSAFIRAWASFEATMRRTARMADLGRKQQSAQTLLGTLYSMGFLELSEYDELNHHLRLRNSVVRGLEVPPIDITVPLFVANVARKLLAWHESEQPA